MKKFFILFLVSSLVTACTSQNTIQHSYNKNANRSISADECSSEPSCTSEGPQEPGPCEPEATQDGAYRRILYACEKIETGCADGKVLRYITAGSEVCN